MVTGDAAAAAQMAPGELEFVRSLLNSWLIPNDSRQPTDEFDAFARGQGWRGARARSCVPCATTSGRPSRKAIPAALNRWIEQLGLRPEIQDGRVGYQHAAGPAGTILAAVLTAVGAGRWSRLKACPDCRWVFYDNTRNGSKRWCLMYAGGPRPRVRHDREGAPLPRPLG